MSRLPAKNENFHKSFGTFNEIRRKTRSRGTRWVFEKKHQFWKQLWLLVDIIWHLGVNKHKIDQMEPLTTKTWTSQAVVSYYKLMWTTEIGQIFQITVENSNFFKPEFLRILDLGSLFITQIAKKYHPMTVSSCSTVRSNLSVPS